MPKGIDNWAPIIIGATIVSLSSAKYIETYVPTPIVSEKKTKGLIISFLGSLNLKKGKKTKKISPTLNAENKSGGILSTPSFPTG